MPTPADYERLAQDFVHAFEDSDASALQRLNAHYRRAFSFDDLAAEVWRRVYAHRQRSSRGEKRQLRLDEAQTVVAQDVGYASWTALLDGMRTGAVPVPAYAIDSTDNSIRPRRQLDDADWDALVDALNERRISAFDAGGLMTDAVMTRFPALTHLTTLSLADSRQLTDDGLRHLARMPHLQHLNLTGTKITDRGLDVLSQLPNLRTFELNWHPQVTDEGMRSLRHCDQLERVDLMGSRTGDGAIAALQGKARLRDFKSGRLVTDEGLRLLAGIPVYASGERGELLIDGPFTDRGLAALVPLAGVEALDIFWHAKAITSAGFALLAQMPRLGALGADGALTDDAAMHHIARMPRLRKLRAQEAAATDAGFEALASSSTLEGFWGRECANFGSRSFRAFSTMPSLRELGVGLGKVDDTALAAFADFPALESLTPIGVGDDGFRHIGQCQRITRLTCMYCRDTTDTATAYIDKLPLRYYYAGLTRITDRSLAILGRMATLEQIEFYEVNGISDEGLPHLAALPRLRELAVDSCPGVTLSATHVFPPHVRVRYAT